MGLFCPIRLLALHFFSSRRISVHFSAFPLFKSNFLLEKPKETKLHVLLDLLGRIGKTDARVGRRKDGLTGWWRRRCVFSHVQPHTPVLQTGIPVRNKFFMGYRVMSRWNTTLIVYVYDKSRDNQGGRESNTSSECFPLAKMPGPGSFTST